MVLGPNQNSLYKDLLPSRQSSPEPPKTLAVSPKASRTGTNDGTEPKPGSTAVTPNGKETEAVDDIDSDIDTYMNTNIEDPSDDEKPSISENSADTSKDNGAGGAADGDQKAISSRNGFLAGAFGVIEEKVPDIFWKPTKTALNHGATINNTDNSKSKSKAARDDEPEIETENGGGGVANGSSRPSRRAKSLAATKIRKGANTDDDDDDNESDDDSVIVIDDSSDADDIDDGLEDDVGSGDDDGWEGARTQNPVAPPRNNPRPSRRAKSDALQKMAVKLEASDDDDEDEDKSVRSVENDEHEVEDDQREPTETVPESPPTMKRLLAEEDDVEQDDAKSNSNGKDQGNSTSDDVNVDEETIEDKEDDDDVPEESENPDAKTDEEMTTESPSENGSNDGKEDGLASLYGTKKRKKAPTKGIKTEDSVQKEGDDESSSNGTKKRKTRSNRAAKVKTEDGVLVKEEGGEEAPKKKPKRARCSEATIKDAAGKMLVVLIKNYKDSVKEVPLDVLAASITTKKGKPYTNHRSDAICEGLKLLQAQSQAEKIKYGNTGAARLFPAEIAKIPKEVICKDPAKVLKQRYQQFLERLAGNKKGGKGETIRLAAKAVWKKLEDGKAYSRKELVAVTAYKGTNSSGFEAIVKVLIELTFVEGTGKKGQLTFTSKVFPHGRP